MSDNSSLATIYDALAYGFDVSWLDQTCDNTALLECNRRNGTCFTRINYAPVCIQYCYLYIPLFQIKFKDRVFNLPFVNIYSIVSPKVNHLLEITQQSEILFTKQNFSKSQKLKNSSLVC
ncbi:hypothetical protein ACJIZ3_021426 [Penstemon smallii]|uniref:Uncharacterized protein n=1 Tax=Penstemon smallii TaxID=265156 RepID=A0ABD3SM90_9LAMI